MLSLLAAAALARPQNDFDNFDSFNSEVANDLGPINPNPQYTYSYQVADDDEQTYLAHTESRDNDEVTGQYSYVDANGALVTVTYKAGPAGYTEERNIQDGFVQIRARPVRVQPVEPVQVAAPIVTTRRPVIVTTPAPVAPAAPSDDDLVARIIAQLTPFIRDTVSTSLQGNQGQASKF